MKNAVLMINLLNRALYQNERQIMLTSYILYYQMAMLEDGVPLMAYFGPKL